MHTIASFPLLWWHVVPNWRVLSLLWCWLDLLFGLGYWLRFAIHLLHLLKICKLSERLHLIFFNLLRYGIIRHIRLRIILTMNVSECIFGSVVRRGSRMRCQIHFHVLFPFVFQFFLSIIFAFSHTRPNAILFINRKHLELRILNHGLGHALRLVVVILRIL
jgi:hypothetical protein